MATLIGLTAITSGTPAVQGYDSAYGFYFNTPWTAGDVWNVAISATSGDFNLGQSPICRIVPTSCITLNNRLHFVSGSYWYGSANGDSTQWDIQSPSAFSVQLFDRTYSNADFVGLCSYQGRIALFAPQAIQIWSLSSDPVGLSKTQDFLNVGTEYPQSIQPLGNLDVLFAHSSGVRSLQVRDASLNAGLVDVGTPVDNTIKAAYGATPSGNVCSVVEPTTGNYWLHVNGTIFVLSYHNAVKLTAWSTYTPTYIEAGLPVTFVPLKFVVSDNVVYCLTSNAIYKYSGTDATTVTVITPYLELQSPAVKKFYNGFDAVFTGQWIFSISTDPWSGIDEVVLTSSQFTSMGTGTKSTFDIGHVPISLRGTHVRVTATVSSTTATLGGLFLHYVREGEK